VGTISTFAVVAGSPEYLHRNRHSSRRSSFASTHDREQSYGKYSGLAYTYRSRRQVWIRLGSEEHPSPIDIHEQINSANLKIGCLEHSPSCFSTTIQVSVHSTPRCLYKQLSSLVLVVLRLVLYLFY